MPLQDANDHSLTVERLREVVTYDPETGLFTWLESAANTGRCGRRAPGVTAGTTRANGYVQINIDGRRYRAHRLAWLYMTGEAPPLQVDHRNGNRSDNKWSNLRLANQQQNSANMLRRPGEAKGVRRYENPRTGIVRYRAAIMVNRKPIFLGSFLTIEEAQAAYAQAANRYFGEFARAA